MTNSEKIKQILLSEIEKMNQQRTKLSDDVFQKLFYSFKVSFTYRF